MQVSHINSSDLEHGNPSKGVFGGIGRPASSPVASWQLQLSTDLDIDARAYLRSPDGFVTSMQELVAETLSEGAYSYHVPFLTPDSNANQTGLIRLINPGDLHVRMVIGGIDDSNQAAPLGDIELTLLAGTATLLTSKQLEEGDPAFVGRIRVRDGQVASAHLLRPSHSGHGACCGVQRAKLRTCLGEIGFGLLDSGA